MKTKIKKQLTQTIAVAAAAVCAVTATFAGVNYQAAPMDVFAADEATSYGIAYVCGQAGSASFWNSTDAGQSPAEITGNGSYEATFTIDGDGSGTVDCLILQSNILSTDYSSFSMAVDGITINGKTVEYTGPSAGCSWDEGGVRVNIYNVWSGTITDIDNVGSWKGDLTIAFTVSGLPTDKVTEGEDTTTTTTETTTTTTETTTTTTETTTTAPDTTESSETTTTTTTEPDKTESSETTTTTTTTEPDTTESSETTSTTEKTESSASETTTTTKETTATTTTTTATTTTPKATTTTSVTLETSIDFTQEKGDDGDGDYNAFVEFDPKGADKVRIVFKVSSSDTQATVSYGCWNNADSKWYDDENLVAIPTDKIVSFTDVVPAKVESTMKISIYYPKAKNVTIQSVTLIYDEAPVVTTTTEFESDLTFETVTIGEANNKIDMLDRCYIIETIKADPGYNIKGGMYSGVKGDTYYTYDEWEATVDESQIIVNEYEIRGAYDASYGIFYYGKGTEKRNSVEVNIQTFYTGDASMNGKVNGSDVRAIVNYLISEEKTNAQDVICDYDDDGEVELTDAVALTKALLSPAKTKALVS